MTDQRYPRPRLYIGGTWRERSAGGEMPIMNPANGAVLAALPLASEAELDEALRSAAQGQQVWRRTPASARADIMKRAVALICERCESLAATMTLEQGKPIGESRLEVRRAAELIEWASEEGRRAYGVTIPSPPDTRYLTFQEPIGVVAAFTPWNFPAVSPARKIGGVLAAGCACILKPSEQTPATAAELVRAFVDAGLPPGTINLVFGVPSKVSSHLIPSPIVRMVTFTGSVVVGKQLAALAAQHMKPSVMELGGHAPTIVFQDTDIEKVAHACAAAKFRNAGQVCTSPTRFFIQTGAYERFVSTLGAAAQSIRVGDGMTNAQMGPLANERRVAAMEMLVGDALSRGARLLAGGKSAKSACKGDGYFFEPTVLTDVPLDARAMKEEPFGPLALCRSFETIAEALQLANALPYGLAAYAFTSSVRTAAEIIPGLECGIVGINSFSGSNPETPFGGIKDSGFGREGGIEGMRSYMTTKFVVEGSL